MAFSSFPSNFLSISQQTSSSQSFFLPKFHPHIRSLQSYRVRKLTIHCCQQAIQLDNGAQKNVNLVRKKRKPRPSFVEQVQNKWSVKTPSLRETFPWQEQKKDGKNEKVQPQKERVKNVPVSEPVSSYVQDKSISISISISPPWIHGSEPREKMVSSEGRAKFQEKGNKKDQGFDGVGGNRLKEEPLVSTWIHGSEPREKMVSSEGRAKFQEKGNKKEQGFDGVGGNRLKEEPLVSIMKEVMPDEFDEIPEKTEILGDENAVLPWEERKDQGFVKEDKFQNRNTRLAEKLIPEPELKRLRSVSLRMLERIKVGAAGVTQALVDSIHEKWKEDEVVKLKFEGPPSKNMKRTHEFLESRTGGLVIWRSGSSLVLYRGMTYNLDCVKSYSKDVVQVVNNSKYYNSLSEKEQMDLSELNLVLDELGPRFIDWSGREPIPVDADLLPPIVPGYKTPFRLLPYGTRPTLRDKEMTYFRRTARTVHPHFALGRNRNLQGLARAIVKLWEKSAIAKIAIKRGVQNTSNERMAEELKVLTGGTLLSRNKEFIVLYRGNDFLPPRVSRALVEAEKCTALKQDEEEEARNRAAATLIDKRGKDYKQPLVAGTLAETVAATSRWKKESSDADMKKMRRDTAIAQQASLVRLLQRKLNIAKMKTGRAEKTLRKVLQNHEPEDLPTDLETLTDEERFLFRKIGWSMKPYLTLGRREVFDGTIENMHLHWKYRELVKIMVERRTFAQVRHIAIQLEAESGGVLVSVDKTTKGYVILVYRGKNYQLPLSVRPKNLLTKRQALARSIELQRREALKHHIAELEEKIKIVKQQLEDMVAANDNGT